MSSFYSRQAIVTSYHGPTDRSGARITARAHAGSVRVQWNYAIGIAENYAAAAQALATKLGWSGDYAIGSLPDGRYVFTVVSDDTIAFKVSR